MQSTNKSSGSLSYITLHEVIIILKTTYLCGTELGSPFLKLSDRCKHVHTFVHVDLLYAVKHGTEDTAQRGTIPEFEKCVLLTL